MTVGIDQYVSLEDANTHLARLGKTPLADDTGDGYLVQATLAIDRNYGGRFIGVRISYNPLEWPRTNATYSNTGRELEDIPLEVEQATAELAYRLYDEGLDPYVQPAPKTSVSETTVDVITVKGTYAGAYQEQALYSTTLVLQPLLNTAKGGAGGSPLTLVK